MLHSNVIALYKLTVIIPRCWHRPLVTRVRVAAATAASFRHSHHRQGRHSPVTTVIFSSLRNSTEQVRWREVMWPWSYEKIAVAPDFSERIGRYGDAVFYDRVKRELKSDLFGTFATVVDKEGEPDGEGIRGEGEREGKGRRGREGEIGKDRRGGGEELDAILLHFCSFHSIYQMELAMLCSF